MLLRQIHPNQMQLGRATSAHFNPTKEHQFKLSLYDGDKITAENSLIHFTETLKKKSYGVLGFTNDECAAASLEAVPDPAPFPEHMLIDFSELTNGQREKRAKKLKKFAIQRNWLATA